MDYVSLLCCLVAFLLYYNTLDAGFVYDDRRAILSNPDLLPSTPWARLLQDDFWGTPLTDSGSHGSYRPLCVLTFRLNYLLGGFQPWGYHLVNVLLHCLATALVVRVARAVLPREPVGPAVAGLVFASHPVHTEAVAGVVGRADLAACNLYLLSFLVYVGHVRWRDGGGEWASVWGSLAVCVGLAVAAMLSKETGITVLGVCLLYDVLHATPITTKQRRSLFVLLASLSLILLTRLQAPTPHFSTADNPTAKHPSPLARLLTFLYLPALNFRLLLLPTTLSFDWGMDSVPRITSLSDPRNLLTAAFYTTLLYTVRTSWTSLNCKEKSCVCSVCRQVQTVQHSQTCRISNNNNVVPMCFCFRRRRPRKPLLTALAFLALPFLPASNLLFYVGFVVAERVLYLPSAGLCLLVGFGAGRLWRCRKFRRATAACVLATVCVFGARTALRNRDWTDEEALYRSAVGINPPKAYGNLGSVLSSQGRVAEAEAAFRKALVHRPNMADVHYNLGVLLQGKQQLSEAILSYQRAIHFRPSLALAYVNLGAALIAAGRCQEAVSVLRQGSRVDGTGLRDRREHETARVSALLQLGALYSDQGRLQRALATYREAAHSLPDHYPPQSVFNVLGETLARLQQDEEAERWYQAALNAQPDHVPAHITYGKLLAKNVSRVAEAEQWFRRAQRIAPEDPTVYHHYGEFLASKGRHKEAAGLYEKAAELRPKDYELSVAAATAMRQAGRHSDAEKWYRKAVGLKPLDARGHTNLGAILHLNGKYREAAASYREALRLQPNDVTTLTNLHRLHSVMT